MYKGNRAANRQADLWLALEAVADCGNGKVKKCAEVWIVPWFFHHGVTEKTKCLAKIHPKLEP